MTLHIGTSALDASLDFDTLSRGFRWQLPAKFNIAEACLTRHARAMPDAPAILRHDVTAKAVDAVSWRQLADMTARIAAALSALGLAEGDRIAIQLPQGVEAVAIHMATYQLGAIAVPLATQFGPSAIAHRIAIATPRVFVGTAAAIERFRAADIGDHMVPNLICVGEDAAPSAIAFGELLTTTPIATNLLAQTTPDAPAMMLFTSGSTGQPKGVVHGHRVLIGHLPGIQIAQDFMPRDGDVFWTPSDWAWAGGLLNALLPALYYGVPVVAANAPRFSAAWALQVLEDCAVTNVFMPPTAIRILASADLAPKKLTLRAVGVAGEALGAKTHAAARLLFDAPVNEFYGQTECNAVIGSSARFGIDDPAFTGRALPGHIVRIRTSDGQIVEQGTGEIVVDIRDDPVCMLRYHDDPDATAAKIEDGWLRTGDLAECNAEGLFRFISRDDDIITSAGYRIGPAEIEDCLNAHPAVTQSGVIGLADAERTETIVAFIALAPGHDKTDTLAGDLKDWVKARLSAHLYPRVVRVIDAIPMTESGKVKRGDLRALASALAVED
ncbi:MAG: AMP-binding protein [Pseudomonadota bacterium]